MGKLASQIFWRDLLPGLTLGLVLSPVRKSDVLAKLALLIIGRIGAKLWSERRNCFNYLRGPLLHWNNFSSPFSRRSFSNMVATAGWNATKRNRDRPVEWPFNGPLDPSKWCIKIWCKIDWNLIFEIHIHLSGEHAILGNFRPTRLPPKNNTAPTL